MFNGRFKIFSRVYLYPTFIVVSPPDAQGAYQMDWTMTSKAVTEVLLDRTPLPHEPDGKSFGGYAGLSVRFARELQEVQATSSQGPVEFTGGRFRGKATAMDYSGTIAGHEAGIAILDHPSNLNAPTPWYVINDRVMRYYSPAVICFQPHRMQADETLTLRYRVIVHPGRWDAERLRSAAERFGTSRD